MEKKQKIQVRPRLDPQEYKEFLEWKEPKNNTLFIADLHCPHTIDGYLEFCIAVHKKYRCTRVVFSGDVLDNGAVSYHEKSPDGLSAGEELERAIVQLKGFHDAFPNAYVLLGNHCRLIQRKMFSGGVPTKWTKPYEEVLETPTWTYGTEFTFDGVLYVHGEGRTAKNRCLKDFTSVCQGHRHSITSLEYFTGRDGAIRFAMQVGAGVDRESYAFAYAKDYDIQQLNCGVVLDGGKYGVIEPFFNK